MKNSIGTELLRFKTDSKEIRKGDIFVAIKGTINDGHDFIDEALKNGALFCIVENKNLFYKKKYRDRLLYVTSTKSEISRLAADFFNDPSKKLKTAGITGTNGKTTVAYLLHHILNKSGVKTGLIGTIDCIVGNNRYPSTHTTPNAVILNYLLNRMLKKKSKAAVMEVSSHALCQSRVESIFFDVAVFTNITPEHLDYHKNMQNYCNAKRKILGSLKNNGWRVVNNDDSLLKSTMGALRKNTLTYGILKNADIKARDVQLDINGASFGVRYKRKSYRFKSSLIGMHNVYNVLAATGTALLLGVPMARVIRGISSFKTVAGRLERINARHIHVYIDYAHTEDGLRNVLDALSGLKRRNIITVFGCGGDRDALKRPKMGNTACRYSDTVVVTNDNPRTEKPGKIIADVRKGIPTSFKDLHIIPDRSKAIEKAIKSAQKGDIVLIAGKGHENFQILGTKKIKFDDYDEAKKILKRLCK